jgi:hypothetical protein
MRAVLPPSMALDGAVVADAIKTTDRHVIESIYGG